MERINSALASAIAFFYVVGGLYIFAYSFEPGKLYYLGLGILVYVLSVGIRHYVTRPEGNKGYSEIGLFFASLLFAGCILQFLYFDDRINTLLPEAIFIKSSIAFIVIVLSNLISQVVKSRVVVIGAVLVLFYVLSVNHLVVESIVRDHPTVVRFIIGSPVVYLFFLLTGIQRKLS